MPRYFVLLVLVLCTAGCRGQHLITGEPLILGVDVSSGAVIDRDVMSRVAQPPLGAIPLW